MMIKSYIKKILDDSLCKHLDSIHERLNTVEEKLYQYLYRTECLADRMMSMDLQWEDKQQDLNANFKNIQTLSNELKGIISMTRASIKGPSTQERKRKSHE